MFLLLRLQGQGEVGAGKLSEVTDEMEYIYGMVELMAVYSSGSRYMGSDSGCDKSRDSACDSSSAFTRSPPGSHDACWKVFIFESAIQAPLSVKHESASSPSAFCAAFSGCCLFAARSSDGTAYVELELEHEHELDSCYCGRSGLGLGELAKAVAST